MTTERDKQERDEEICKALGLCWHEKRPFPAADISKELSKKERVFKALICSKCNKALVNASEFNPNFSTDSGMCLILRKGPAREWWHKFMQHIASIPGSNFGFSYQPKPIKYRIPLNLLQDPNRLANELERFLDGRNK